MAFLRDEEKRRKEEGGRREGERVGGEKGRSLREEGGEGKGEGKVGRRERGTRQVRSISSLTSPLLLLLFLPHFFSLIMIILSQARKGVNQ